MTALIFDMDGLLFDTETLYFKATQQIVARYGHTVRIEDYADWIGRDVTFADFQALFPCDLSERELATEVGRIFDALCEAELKLRPGVAEFLARVADFPKAIASSTHRRTIDRHLAQMGLAEQFPVRASGKECARGKPAPDVFLAAAAGLEVAPERCVVFEDSPHGVQGAKAAGMRAVAVPTEFTAHCDFGLADRRVDSLLDIDPAWLRQG
jgi:HAD superfamily hydrolase (TIGR01509 family)